MKIKKLLSTIAALAIAASSFAGLGITANAAVGDVTTVLDNTLTDATTLTDTDTYTWGTDIAGIVTANGIKITNENDAANNYEDKSFVSFTNAVGDETHQVDITYDGYSVKDKGQAATISTMSYYDADGNFLFGIGESSGGWAYSASLTYADSATTTATVALPAAHISKAGGSQAVIKVAYTADGGMLTVDGTTYTFVGGGIKDIKLSVSGGADYSRYTCISNYKMTTTEVEAVVPANYTINYLKDGTNVKTVTGTSTVGATVIADSPVTADDGSKYYALDGETLTMSLVDGTNTLDIDVRDAEVYDITVNAIGDITKAAFGTDTIVEGESKDATWPMYIVEEGIAYSATPVTNYYSQSISSASADTTIDVTYTKAYENVVLYDELDGSTGNNANVRASNGSAYDNAAYTSSANLEPGKYTVVLRVLNKGRGSTMTIGDTTVASSDAVDKNSWGNITSEEFVVTEAAPLVWNKGASAYDPIDTVIVIKTGDLPSLTVATATPDGITAPTTTEAKLVTEGTVAETATTVDLTDVTTVYIKVENAVAGVMPAVVVGETTYAPSYSYEINDNGYFVYQFVGVDVTGATVTYTNAADVTVSAE